MNTCVSGAAAGLVPACSLRPLGARSRRQPAPRPLNLAPRCQQQEEESSGQRRFYGSFVRAPVRVEPPPRPPCSRCADSGLVTCLDCAGTGRLSKGGYNKHNPVSAARIVGSKWTAMQRTFGWRHFRVSQKKKDGKDTFIEMVSTCDETTKFWLNMRTLRERERWAAGWLQKAELQQREQEAAGAECKACSGGGRVPCPLCSNRGEVVEL